MADEKEKEKVPEKPETIILAIFRKDGRIFLDLHPKFGDENQRPERGATTYDVERLVSLLSKELRKEEIVNGVFEAYRMMQEASEAETKKNKIVVPNVTPDVDIRRKGEIH